MKFAADLRCANPYRSTPRQSEVPVSNEIYDFIVFRGKFFFSLLLPSTTMANTLAIALLYSFTRSTTAAGVGTACALDMLTVRRPGSLCPLSLAITSSASQPVLSSRATYRCTMCATCHTMSCIDSMTGLLHNDLAC